MKRARTALLICKHPERPHSARGMCDSCYRGWLRNKNPETVEAIKVYKRKWRYGLTSEDYDKILSNQLGVCAICRDPVKEVLNVDHNHKTGRVRGLLCHGCNTALGKFKDSREILERAILYLGLGE